MKFRITQSVAGGILALSLFAPFGMAHEVAEAVDYSSPSPRAEAAGTQLMTRIKVAADKEVVRRIAALNALSARVQLMKRVSDTEKAAIATEVQTQVSSLTTLKAKVDADTDLVTLRADVASIVYAYRIYILVIPRGRIVVAADRISTIAGEFATLGEKLQSRIEAAQAAGKDVTALTATMADFNTKVSGSTVKAQAAVSAVSSLVPDNGDQTKLQANQAALRSARADLLTARQNLVAALKDARSVIQALKGMNLPPASVTP